MTKKAIILWEKEMERRRIKEAILKIKNSVPPEQIANKIGPGD